VKNALVVVIAIVLAACASGAANTELLDRDWTLISPNAHDGLTAPTIRFGTDGRVSGSTGCNMTNGSYTVNGDAVTMGPMITTRRACVEERGNELERTYVTALEAARRFRIVNGELELLDGSGSVVARFR
jgi:heat shock protein HslJ